MDDNRRRFLKIAGLSILGMGIKPAADALASAEPKMIPSPEALVGKRWAMVVNMKKLREGGTEVMDRLSLACHSTHNVPDMGNPKSDVKWLWQEPYEHAFPGTESEILHKHHEGWASGLKVLVLCNHCDNPPCVRVCPTKATWKRPDGIVMMDYHRCIGCRYCMAACPYGARSLNWQDPRPFIKTELNREYPTRTRGVVEKCTFCFERLAKGLKPACVDAAKNKELVFGDMEDPKSEVRELLKTNFFIRRKPELGTSPQVYYIL